MLSSQTELIQYWLDLKNKHGQSKLDLWSCLFTACQLYYFLIIFWQLTIKQFMDLPYTYENSLINYLFILIPTVFENWCIIINTHGNDRYNVKMTAFPRHIYTCMTMYSATLWKIYKLLWWMKTICEVVARSSSLPAPSTWVPPRLFNQNHCFSQNYISPST